MLSGAVRHVNIVPCIIDGLPLRQVEALKVCVCGTLGGNVKQYECEAFRDKDLSAG